MKISIIGASAGLGLETVKRALQRNHEVTTLSRSVIELSNTSVFTSIIGSATNKSDLLKAIKNAEAVIVTLGTGKNMKATHLFSDFARTAVEIQKEHNLNIPFIVVTGFGAGKSQNYVSWFVKMFLKFFLKDIYADKTKLEETFASSQMKWIIIRPGRLLDLPLTEKYRIETKLYKGINIGGINRADVADYAIKQAENPTELGKYVAIAQI